MPNLQIHRMIHVFFFIIIKFYNKITIILKHQRINEEIVEELLQSDGIKHLSDVTSLKLIIY